MTKIKDKFQFGNIEDIDQMGRFMELFNNDINDLLNGNLEFDDNLRTSTLSVNFTTANAQLQIAHSLGRTPIGYILAKTNTPARLYDGGTLNDSKFVYIKSDAVANTTIVVF